MNETITWYPLEWTDRLGRVHQLEFSDPDQRLSDSYLLGLMFECQRVQLLDPIVVEPDPKAVARLLQRVHEIKAGTAVERAMRLL